MESQKIWALKGLIMSTLLGRPEAFPDLEAVEGGEYFYVVFRRAK